MGEKGKKRKRIKKEKDIPLPTLGQEGLLSCTGSSPSEVVYTFFLAVSHPSLAHSSERLLSLKLHTQRNRKGTERNQDLQFLT